jgi:transposase
VVTDAQVRRLLEEMSDHGQIGLAALRSGMHRNTARRYVTAGKMPSQLQARRTWRTREDPFAEDWEAVVDRLADAPELEAKALFEDLMQRHPGRYRAGQLRTFQRRVKQWRAEHGPPREIFFPQEHRPGEAMQTDFTWASRLGVQIAGEAFDHQLCQSVLPYSNWQSVVVCQSESMLALRCGVQRAVFRLGRVPRWHQTDNSTAATHDLSTGKRGFNREYEELMEHLGMKPRTIAIGASHQNGDVEASSGALKRRLEQHLLLRGSRDFPSVEVYEGWIDSVLE